jgi:hypothetical protein
MVLEQRMIKSRLVSNMDAVDDISIRALLYSTRFAIIITRVVERMDDEDQQLEKGRDNNRLIATRRK